MFRPRIIPVLLLKGQGLVKSVKFSKYRYIGDPINAVKIFNDLEADELVFMDINASNEGRCISLDFVKSVGEEANMPFSVGGGIRSIDQIRAILAAGAEKVVLNTSAGLNPGFISESANAFGSSTITVCMDIKRNFFGKPKVWIEMGKKALGYSPLEYARLIEKMGAGELVVQSIEKDGMMTGYDLELLKSISDIISIPLVALGGAGKFDDFRDAIWKSNCSAVGAGSMFVYHSERRGILVNYPNKLEKSNILKQY
jgi:cyclase